MGSVYFKISSICPRCCGSCGLAVEGDWWKGYGEGSGRGGRGGRSEGSERLGTWVGEFYMTDVVSRASKVMARCVKYKA